MSRLDLNKDGKVDAKDFTHFTKKTTEKIKSEVKKNTFKAILAAFAFVIALVWKDAIKDGVDIIIQQVGLGTGYMLQIISAIIVTIICVVAIILFSKLKGKEDIK